MKKWNRGLRAVLFVWSIVFSYQLNADHHTGGELRYSTLDSASGTFIVELILDRYCNKTEISNSLSYSRVEYSGTSYLSRGGVLKYLKSRFIPLPCSTDTFSCSTNSGNKIERRYYYDTIVLQKSNKECLIYYSGSNRSYSDNLATWNSPFLLFLVFNPNFGNSSTQLDEPIRYSLVTNTSNRIRYDILDQENDSFIIQPSVPFIGITPAFSGYSMSYSLEKASMNPTSLTDARPLEISESSVQFNFDSIILSPSSSKYSWLTLLRSEYRKIKLGLKDTSILMSKSNIERLLVSSGISSQFALNSVKSTAPHVRITGSKATICNEGTDMVIKYSFPIEKSINITRYQVFANKSNLSNICSSQRISGSSMDTLQISLNYSPLNVDTLLNLEFQFSACHSFSNTSFTKTSRATIEEFNYHIFGQDSILSCSPTAKIDLKTKKSVVFSYGTRVLSNPNDYLFISAPRDTWIHGQLSSPNAFCPYKDSIYLNQGSVFTTSVQSYSPSCSGYCDGRAKLTITGSNSPYGIYWSNSSNVDSISSLCPGKYSVQVKDRDNCIQYDSALIADLRGIEAFWSIDTPIRCYGYSNGRGHMQITSTLRPSTYTWDHTSSTDSFLSGMSAGTYSGKYGYVNQFGKSCSQNFSFVMIQPDSIKISFIVNDNPCFADSIGKIAILPIGGNGLYSIFKNDTISGSPVFANLRNGAYKFYARDFKGCISHTQFITVGSPAKIAANVVLTHPSCIESKNGKIEILNPSGGTNPFRFKFLNTWYDTSLIVNGIDLGTYSIRVQDANNCILDTSVKLVPSYKLLATFDSFSNSLCPRSDAGYVALRVNNGQSPFTLSLNGTSSNLTSNLWINSSLKKGNYTVQIKDKNQCPWDSIFEITEPDTFAVSSIVQHVTCYNGSDGKITALVTGGSSPYMDIKWYGVQGEIVGSENLKPGIYRLKLKDKFNCKFESFFEILNKPEFKVLIEELKKVSCYAANDGQLRQIAIGGISPFSYSWLNTSSKDEILSNVSAGSYVGEVIDKDGCKAVGNFSVLQPLKLKIDNIKTNSQNCSAPIDGAISIIASGGTVNGIQSYQYAIDTAKGFSLNNTFTDMRLGRYTITVRDINRCKLDTIFNFVNGLKIETSLSSVIPIALGEIIRLTPSFAYGVNTSFNDIKSVTWTPSTGLSCIDCIEPLASPFKTTTYKITVRYGIEDCQSEATTTLEVANAVDVYIPNSFTPNSDSVNDVWMVYGKNILDIKISVYDKTGELMYRSDNIRSGWNGSYKGEPCKIDAYTYIVKTTYIDGSTQQYTGILNLLR